MSIILHSQPEPRPDVLTHLSGNLRRLRQAKGVSQDALARQAGLSRRMISSIEGGAANVSLSTVDKLAAALSAKFTDLVRPPESPSALHIDSTGWRGEMPQSEAVLLGAAPGSRETELWLWSLGPGEHYASEAGSDGWHEMLYVIEGTLTMELPDQRSQLPAGRFLIFSSGAAYRFVNATDGLVRYLRSIVL